MAAWNRLGGRPRRFGGTQGGSGIGWLSHSRIVQRWSVRPAAIAGVRSCHFRRCPVPAAIRRLSWTQQTLEAQPTKYIPAVRASTLRAIARPRRVSGLNAPRKVALSRSRYSLGGPELPMITLVELRSRAESKPKSTAERYVMKTVTLNAKQRREILER